MLPPQWSVKPLGQLCVQDRQVVPPDSDLAKQLPFLGLEHIESSTGRILRNDLDGEVKVHSLTFEFDSRHVLYGKLRPYLNKVALPDFRGRCTTELVPLLPAPNVSRRYLAWLLRRSETVAFAMKGRTGSRMPRANLEELMTLGVPIPNSLTLQDDIADAMEQRMERILAAKSSCLKQINLLDELAKRMLIDFPTSQALEFTSRL